MSCVLVVINSFYVEDGEPASDLKHHAIFNVQSDDFDSCTDPI